MKYFTEADVAMVCHNVNKAYCESVGDNSQVAWEDAPEWQKTSAINGVHLHFFDEVTPEQSHESWLAEKERDGWVYGTVKDVEKKEHPCFVPYDQLPKEQQIKDHLFKAVVDSFKSANTASEPKIMKRYTEDCKPTAPGWYWVAYRGYTPVEPAYYSGLDWFDSDGEGLRMSDPQFWLEMDMPTIPEGEA